MNKKIGIIGHFGGGHTFLDGQTVKTKVFYEELKKRGFNDIFCVDTYYNKTNKLRLMWDTIKCFCKCHTVVVLLSDNGLKVYMPILYYAKKFFKIRIFHNVVGGHLHTDIKNLGQKMVKYLNAIDGNWVETVFMKNALEEAGIQNCSIITNFKKLNTDAALPAASEEGKYKFCMFSRVTEDKGITDAIEAISICNERSDKKITLDIWGSIDSDYKEKFEELLKKHADYVYYGGKIDFDRSVSVLTDHIALLFPTHYKGEGCPGTLIDAYASNLPVISSKWDAANEMIKEFETGWIYPNGTVSNLAESIEWAVNHQDEMAAMRRNCALLAKRYTPDYVMRRIINEMK